MELNVFLLVLTLLMIHHLEASEETVSSVISACPGEQLKLTCTENQTSVLWTIIFPEGNITHTRNVPFTGNIGLLPVKETFNGTDAVTFNFTLTSEARTLPLTTDLCIDRINSDIHGTEIHCSPSKESDPQVTFIIHVLGANSDLFLLEVDQTLYDFKDTNFTVILNWTQGDSVSYNISIEPITELIHLMNSTWQVIGNYNTVYNVSIEATLCEEYSKTTNIILEYATCGLLTKESLGISDPMLKLKIESRNPVAIAGDSVTFYCINGELIGLNRTECQGNQNWEPDPMANEIMCKPPSKPARCGPPPQPINGYILANTSTSVTFMCQNQTQLHPETTFSATCNNGMWEPDLRDHCISADSKSKGNLNGTLVGVVLGSLFVAVAIFIAVVLTIVILLKKVSEENMYNTVSDQSPVENQNSIDQPETVMYADIGPSSFKKKSHIILGPEDDDHIEYAQLNQNLLTVKGEETKQKMEMSFIDDRLNLDTLLIQIKTAVTSRWYQLGEALGINKESLDKYSNHSPEDSIVEMLDQWLRSGPERQTWRDVAEALKKIGLHQLALNIEKVYETGKLPIEVNMNDVPHDSLPPKLTELPPPLPSKMKQNSSDSNLIKRHQRTLPARVKQNSDSTLINNQHGIHNRTICTREILPLQLVQETTLASPVLDSDSIPPPLPPKPTAASDVCIDVAVPSRPPKNYS